MLKIKKAKKSLLLLLEKPFARNKYRSSGMDAERVYRWNQEDINYADAKKM